MNSFTAILLMAGNGSRFNNSTNKALLKIDGEKIYQYSLNVFKNHECCKEIFLVVNKNDFEEVKNDINDPKIKIILGGSTRQESVKNALKMSSMDVIIHDAARPIIYKEDIDYLLNDLENYDAVTFYEKCTDTYRIKTNGGINNLNRDEMLKIVTPQGFKKNTFKTILNANVDNSITDEITILLNTNFLVNHLVVKHPMPKLTYTNDLGYIEYLLGKNRLEKIGHSFDFHPFMDGNGLKLGGVFIEFKKSLKGWSDGDPLIHSITEAIIGALGLGDIGKHFPDNDPRYKGIDSNYFLNEARILLEENQFEIVNIDSIVYLEKPNLKNYKSLMEDNIAQKLNISKDLVNVKATTMEQKGLVGKGEGIGAETVVLIKRRSN